MAGLPLLTAALLVLAACVAGTLLAGAGAQTWTWRTADHAAGSQVPGGAVALPLLGAWALTGEVADGPLAALAGPVVTAGLLLVLAGAVVLLLPAPGLRSAPRAVAA